MRSRLILLVLILGVWVGLKALDEFVTGPEVLTLLALACVMMLGHSIWLLIAQGHWRLKTRRHARRREAQEARGGLPSVLGAEEKSVWTPFVDIFISAKNESKVIEKTVRNFFAIDYEHFYLWIINDCSTDSMGTILDSLKDEFPRLRVLHRTPGCCPGKSAALNEALPLAKGEVIAVFDADAYVAPDFFAVTVPVLEADGVGAVQAQKKIYDYQHGFLVECQSSEYALDTYFQMGRDLIGGAVELRGNGQVLKRAALIDVGGWNNKSITDDLDLSMRLLVSNWDIRFCPNAYVFEEAVPTLKGLIRQRRRWAEGGIIRYLDYIFPLNSPTRLSLVERIDTLVFTVYFVVPALILCEILSECAHLIAGIPTNGKLFGLISIAVLLITQMNMIVAIRMYRPQLGLYKTILHSFEVNAYLYGHWVPVIIVSFCQILFGRKTSTWHPTQHGQDATATVENSV